MNHPVDLLQNEVDKQTSGLSNIVTNSESAIVILMLLREMDVLWMFDSYFQEEALNGNLPVLQALQSGWHLLLRVAYSKLTMASEPMAFFYEPHHSEWIVPLIRCSGHIAYVQRVVDMARHQLITLKQVSKTDFRIEPSSRSFNAEVFDKMDVTFVREVFIDEIDAQNVRELEEEWPRMQHVIDSTACSPISSTITYTRNAEVDDYFERRARLHIRRLQFHEDFGDEDEFGGIPYRKYVDFVETVMAVAYRHTAYCISYSHKNPTTHLASLLTFAAEDGPFTESFVTRFGLSVPQMEQMLSCLTLSPDNFQEYLTISAVAPPPYVRMSGKHSIRTVNGCLNNPFQFLNFELKRRWPEDYFEAVTQREDRFRRDIFRLFPDEYIVKVPRQINIKVNGCRTDIDCVIYDARTKTLGLFQLKWQEPFAHSLKKRRNSSEEFYKANKWVDRVCSWLDAVGEKQLLTSLQVTRLKPTARAVSAVHIFVIGRYAAHFTNGEPDGRAVWGSWWQMVANMGKVKSAFDDPIKLAAISLEFMKPSNRVERNEIPDIRLPSVSLGKYTVHQY